MRFVLSRDTNLHRGARSDRERGDRGGVRRRVAGAFRALTVILAVVIGFSGLAFASVNSKYGPTGLLQIPTADVAQSGEIGLSFQINGGPGVAALRVGVFDHLELGIANTVGGTGTEFMPHIKFQLTPEAGNHPGVAVGLTRGDTPYIVASKQLPTPQYRAHVGVMGGDVGNLFFGASAALNPVQVDQGGWRLPSTLLIGEFIGGDGVNLGARFSLARGLSLDVGIRDFNDTILGISYRTWL